MHAEDAVDPHARRITTDAQGQRLGEVPGEAGQVTDGPFVDSLGRLDFDERRGQAGALDDQIDLDACSRAQVRDLQSGYLYCDRCTIWVTTKCSNALPYS